MTTREGPSSRGYALDRPGYATTRSGGDARPRRPPRRPKGRLFFAAILAGVSAWIGWGVYSAFWRYRAHGVVEAKVYALAPLAEGLVTSIAAVEGASVRKGTVLLVIDERPRLEDEERVRDEIALARAELDAERVRLEWETAYQIDLYYRALGECRVLAAEVQDARVRASEEATLLGRAERRRGQDDIPEIVERDELEAEIHSQESRRAEIQDQLARATSLAASAAVARERPLLLTISLEGQEKRIEEMKNAAQELRRRIDISKSFLEEERQLAGLRQDRWQGRTDLLEAALAVVDERTRRIEGYLADGADALAPREGKIATLENELARVRSRSDQYRVESPVDGTILRVERRIGERTRRDEPAIRVLEEGSAEVVLYLRQRDLASLQPGDEIELGVEGAAAPVICRVARTCDSGENAPSSIERHYRAGEALFPVRLRPVPGTAPLVPGAVVHWKRPIELPAWLEFLR